MKVVCFSASFPFHVYLCLRKLSSMAKQKLSIGAQSFAQIGRDNMIYVDKLVDKWNGTAFERVEGAFVPTGA